VYRCIIHRCRRLIIEAATDPVTLLSMASFIAKQVVGKKLDSVKGEQYFLLMCCQIRCHLSHFVLIRSTLRQSRPNKADLKCPSVRPSVRSQKVSLISMKFGL